MADGPTECPVRFTPSTGHAMIGKTSYGTIRKTKGCETWGRGYKTEAGTLCALNSPPSRISNTSSPLRHVIPTE